MTDAELIAAIAKIIRTKPRIRKADRASAEARDLARYDQIAGLIARHVGPPATAVLGILKPEGKA